MNSQLQTRTNSARNQSAVLLCAVGFLMACLTLCATGCSLFNSDSTKDKPDALKKITKNESAKTASKDEEKVRFDGGLLLGDTDNMAFMPKTLGPLLANLIDKQKWHSLKEAVQTYPDVILKLIVEADGQTIPWSHTRIVARLFDSQWNSNGKDSWQQFVEQIAENTSDPQGLISGRAKFMELLSHNQPTKALGLKLSRGINSGTVGIVRAEVFRLEGIAYLMLEDYSKSIERFSKAIQHSKDQPFLASQIALLLGEAQRHAKAHEDWKQSWTSAIEIRGTWTAKRGLNDPGFWKKAAFLRPVDSEWPSDVIKNLGSILSKNGLDFPSTGNSAGEAVVWATIGLQSLNRHESQNAILAFKKAESLISNRALTDSLQMQQALAMIDAGQPGPASAILIRLSSGQGLLADRAKAILATLKLSNGSIAQGMNLLQSAIKTANQWPTTERLRAQADFGLALLMRGREKEGVKLLNQVHKEFMSRDNFEHASQCVWNLAKYYEKTDQTKKYEAAVARMKKLESSL